MSGYNNREAWTFVRNLVASSRLDNLPFDKSPLGDLTGNPFLDGSLTHDEAKTIDGARMFATIATIALENDSVSAAFEPLLDKAGLMDVVFAANEHERLVRELAAEREAEKTKQTSVPSIVTPEKKNDTEEDNAPGAPYKKRDFDDGPPSPMRVIDFRSQIPTGVLGWVGTVGGAGVTLFLGLAKNDESEKIAEIILPEPIDGFETLESILKRQRLKKNSISVISYDFWIWMFKYYGAYMYKFQGKVLAMALGSIVAVVGLMLEMNNTALVSDLMMLFAYNSDKATRSQVDKSLVSIIEQCGDSGEADLAHKQLVGLVAERTQLYVKKALKDRDATEFNRVMDFIDIDLDRDSDSPQLKPYDYDMLSKIYLGTGGKIAGLMGRIPNLFTSDTVKELIEQAVSDSSSGKTTAQKRAIGFASTAREFAKGADYCMKEASESAVDAINVAYNAITAKEDLRPSSENPLGTGTKLSVGLVIVFILERVWNATRKRAEAHENVLRAYAYFLMNRQPPGPSNAPTVPTIGSYVRSLETCIRVLTEEHNRARNKARDTWYPQIDVNVNQIGQYATQRQDALDAVTSNSKKMDEYKGLASDCERYVNNLKEIKDKVEKEIKKIPNMQFDDSRDICLQLLTQNRAASPASTRNAGGRPATSPARRRPTNARAPDGTPLLSIDEMVDRFKASRLHHSGTA